MDIIGKKIFAVLKSQGKTVKDFAEAIGIQRTNAYRIFNSHSLDKELLFRISCYLNHDFFSEYSERINDDHTETEED